MTKLVSNARDTVHYLDVVRFYAVSLFVMPVSFKYKDSVCIYDNKK